MIHRSQFVWLRMFFYMKLASPWNPKGKLCDFNNLIVPLELCKIIMKMYRYLLPAS